MSVNHLASSNEISAILSLNGISKSFKQGERFLEILKHIEVSFSKAKRVAILGQSGSGKSTLLALMGGLDVPEKGSITIMGKEFSSLGERDRSKLRAKYIGIIFQQFHLLQHLTALENVRLVLEIMDDERADEKARELLSQVGLGDRKDHFPYQLSGGECQRVAIARALACSPKIILADEPSGNLDGETGKQVMSLLFDVCRKHESLLILVTHNLELARECEEIFELRVGKLSKVHV